MKEHLNFIFRIFMLYVLVNLIGAAIMFHDIANLIAAVIWLGILLLIFPIATWRRRNE